jgi:hypothetical protein
VIRIPFWNAACWVLEQIVATHHGVVVDAADCVRGSARVCEVSRLAAVGEVRGLCDQVVLHEESCLAAINVLILRIFVNRWNIISY